MLRLDKVLVMTNPAAWAAIRSMANRRTRPSRPRGAVYTTIIELSPQNHNKDGVVGPNSTMVGYMDPLGETSAGHPTLHAIEARACLVLKDRDAFSNGRSLYLHILASGNEPPDTPKRPASTKLDVSQ